MFVLFRHYPTRHRRIRALVCLMLPAYPEAQTTDLNMLTIVPDVLVNILAVVYLYAVRGNVSDRFQTYHPCSRWV